MQNDDQSKRLLDLATAEGSAGLGATMLRLAQMAAAQHRAQLDPKHVTPWNGLSRISDFNQDNAGHGRPPQARLTRLGGTDTTEGDR